MRVRTIPDETASPAPRYQQKWLGFVKARAMSPRNFLFFENTAFLGKDTCALPILDISFASGRPNVAQYTRAGALITRVAQGHESV